MGMYVADRQVVRYYVDGEANASIVFEPARACGSGMVRTRLCKLRGATVPPCRHLLNAWWS